VTDNIALGTWKGYVSSVSSCMKTMYLPSDSVVDRLATASSKATWEAVMYGKLERLARPIKLVRGWRGHGLQSVSTLHGFIWLIEALMRALKRVSSTHYSGPHRSCSVVADRTWYDVSWCSELGAIF
jgi:hypothetical protein